MVFLEQAWYKIEMKRDYLELYTDYLISNSGAATATELSAMMNNEISHDQVTRFLSSDEFDSKTIKTQANQIAFMKLQRLKGA